MLRKSQLPDKLTPRNQGPYKVVSHDGNWVTVRNLIFDYVKVFDQSDLTLFVGSEADAMRVAQCDADQFEIVKIAGHAGNPRKRMSMDFLVVYKNGDSRWCKFSQDIAQTQRFEEYCQPRPELRQLLITEDLANKFRSACLKVPITLVKPGDVVYVDIRSWNTYWYSTLDLLPDKDTLTYVVRCEYGQFCGSKKRPNYKIKTYFPAMFEEHESDNVFVNEYGLQFN